MNKTKRIIEILKDRNCAFLIELVEFDELSKAPFELKIKIIGELSDEYEAIDDIKSVQLSSYKSEIEDLIRGLYPLK